MDENIITKRGEVVGIGTINILKFKKINKKLPVFSFVVRKGKDEEKGLFISTCIDLRIDGYGKTDLNAIEGMNKNVCRFLLENFTNPKCKDNAWNNLEKLARFDDWAKELWNVYKMVEYKFAEKNKSLYSMSLMDEQKEKQKGQHKPANKKKNELHSSGRSPENRKEKQEVIFISPQGAIFKNIEFNPKIIEVRKPISSTCSPIQSLSLRDGIIFGQMADLRNMKIKPWFQQPEEGKKRCIQPLQL